MTLKLKTDRGYHDIQLKLTSVAIDMDKFDKFMTHLGFKCGGSNYAMRLNY